MKTLYVLAILMIVFGTPALAGPQPDQALSAVEAAWERRHDGLEQAEAALWAVEAAYPEAIDAIALARYRLSEIYAAGGRWQEAGDALAWTWMKIDSGQLTDPDRIFWCAYQYARCLDNLGEDFTLPAVCDKALDIYHALLPMPGEGKISAAGWLHYFKAKALYGSRDYAQALPAAEAAWELGKQLENGALASWAAYYRAQCHVELFDGPNAVEAAEWCVNEYSPHMHADYQALARMALAKAYSRNGQIADASAALVPLLEDPGANPHLKADALNAYALACASQGDEAQAVSTWQQLLDDYPNQDFWRRVAQGQLVQRQALAPGAVLEQPEDPGRPAAAVAIVAATQFEDRKALLRDAILACGEDIDALDQLLYGVRPNTMQLDRWPAYEALVDSASGALPPVTYAREKARCIQFAGYLGDADFAHGLALCNGALPQAYRDADRLRLYYIKTGLLYLLHMDEEGDALVETWREARGARQRMFTGELVEVAWDLLYKRPEIAIALYDKALRIGTGAYNERMAFHNKAVAYDLLSRPGDVENALAELVALEPLEDFGGEWVGSGLLKQAHQHLKRKEYGLAAAKYEEVLQASHEYSAVLGAAYVKYGSMLWHLDDPALQSVVERGVHELNRKSYEAQRRKLQSLLSK